MVADARPRTAPRPGMGGRRSWVDALLASLEGHALGPGAIAGIVGAVVAALVVAERVAAGTSLDPVAVGNILISVSFPVLFIWVLVPLNGIARRALERARPVLDLSDEDVEAFAAALVRTPAGPANLAVLVGVVAGTSSVLSSPSGYGLSPGMPGIVWAEQILFSSLASAGALVYAAHALHQLRLVRRLTREHATVDLYRLQPLYAFSTLTAWTGGSLLAITVFGLAAIQLVQLGSPVVFSTVDVATVAVMIGVAVACFVLPLLGLHGRIVEAKQAAVGRAMLGLRDAVAYSEDRLAVAAGADLIAAKNGVDAAVASLAAVRGISTWPWRQETFRGFLSALGLPILLWLIQNVVLKALVS